MKILIGGDYYPAYSLKPVIEKGDYSIFDVLAPLTHNVDYSIVNFESPVVIENYAPIKKWGPNLYSSKKAVEAISYAGFNLVTLANNHILDYGEKGILDTLKVCSEYHIETVGAGKNLREASAIFYKEINGKVLGIINCCEHEFSIASEYSSGANPLNPVQQYYKICEAKELADYVIVIVHGGHEHFQLPSLRMVETYHFFVDAGADVVVNHHQHCYSGYEVYKGKPIFYGLGNFCFDKPGKVNTTWNEGFLLELSLLPNNITFELHPYLQCNGDTKIDFLKNKDEWNSNIEKLNLIISDASLLQKECERFYKKQRKRMLMLFEPYWDRISAKLYQKGFLPSILFRMKEQQIKNVINCESHRDVLTYCIG